MKPLSTNDNYIPQLITLGCIMIFSLAVCSIALNCGADGFTAFGLFILSSLISTALFLAIQSILQDLFLLLIKFPKEERTVKKLDTSPKIQLSNYEQYRQEALLAKAEEERNKINTVLSYTEKTLAPYVVESELSNLCTPNLSFPIIRLERRRVPRDQNIISVKEHRFDALRVEYCPTFWKITQRDLHFSQIYFCSCTGRCRSEYPPKKTDQYRREIPHSSTRKTLY